MANGNGSGMINKVFASIATAGILGGVGLAIAQAQTAEKVEANSREIEARTSAVHSVAVIENEMENVQEKLDTVKKENDADHKQLNERMESNKQEILDAINEIHKH